MQPDFWGPVATGHSKCQCGLPVRWSVEFGSGPGAPQTHSVTTSLIPKIRVGKEISPGAVAPR